MQRREFIRSSCIACLGLSVGATVLAGCTGTRYAHGTLNNNGMLIDIAEFDTRSKGKRPYVVVRHDDLSYPICIYRHEDDTYTALLMRCTHQGVELQVSGDQLTCPAHGSEFDNRGQVMQAPAPEPLRTFPVSVTGTQLFIDLRKQA